MIVRPRPLPSAAELAKEYSDGGTIAGMRRKYRVDGRRIRRALVDAGVNLRTASDLRRLMNAPRSGPYCRRSSKGRPITDETIDKMAWMYANASFSLAALNRRFGIPPSTIRILLDEAGVEIRSHSEARRRVWDQKGEAERMATGRRIQTARRAAAAQRRLSCGNLPQGTLDGQGMPLAPG